MKISILFNDYLYQYCAKIFLPFFLFFYAPSHLISQAGGQQEKMRKLLCKEWIQNLGSKGIDAVQHPKAELVATISLNDDNSFEYFNGKTITGVWRFNAADSILALKSKDKEQIFVLVFLNSNELKLKSYFDRHKPDAAIIRFVANK